MPKNIFISFSKYFNSVVFKIFSLIMYFFLSLLKMEIKPGATSDRIFFGITNTTRTAAFLKAYKLKLLFGNTFLRNKILYSCSGNIPLSFCISEKKRGVKIILNQNGVYYPAWYGNDYRKANERQLLGHYQLADYIIYQSSFCKESAEKFLGEAQCPSEIIYNPVDTELFVPKKNQRFNANFPVLIATGNFYSEAKYERLRLLVESFQMIHKEIYGASLIIAGYFIPEILAMIRKRIKECCIENRVTFLPSYMYKDAPAVYQRGDIYINTQFNDCCPSAVLEAMSCALPVTYLNCGGTPELVKNAGEGVLVEMSWTSFQYPEPESVKDAVLRIIKNYQVYSAAARKRCIENYDQPLWKKKHEILFQKVLHK